MARAWLSLGSNIAPEANLRAAIAALHARFDNLVASPLYRTAAVGFDGADFLNAAAGIDCDLSPVALDEWLHALEDAYGRDRSGPRYGDRPLDIDIVFYDDMVLDGGTSSQGRHLQIPRLELQHAFVLKPLFDIAPELVDPRSGCTLAQLWAAHPQHGVPMAVVGDSMLD